MVATLCLSRLRICSCVLSCGHHGPSSCLKLHPTPRAGPVGGRPGAFWPQAVTKACSCDRPSHATVLGFSECPRAMSFQKDSGKTRAEAGENLEGDW